MFHFHLKWIIEKALIFHLITTDWVGAIYSRFEAYNALISNGSKLDIKNLQGQTALMISMHLHQYLTKISINLNVVCIFGSISHLNSLIHAGADMNIQDNNGQTTLFYDNSCLKILLFLNWQMYLI